MAKEAKTEDMTVVQYVESLGDSAEVQRFGNELFEFIGRSVMLSDIPEGYTQDRVSSLLKPTPFVIPFMKTLKPFYVQHAANKNAQQGGQTNAIIGVNGGQTGQEMDEKTQAQSQQSTKIITLCIYDINNVEHEFSFEKSTDPNSTTITKSVQQFDSALNDLQFFLGKQRLFTDLQWNDYATTGSDVYGRLPENAKPVSKQVSLTAKKNDTCCGKVYKAVVNPITAPFIIGVYPKLKWFYYLLVFWFVLMIGLGIGRGDWISVVVDLIGVFVTIVVKCCSSDADKKGKKQYKKWQIDALTCNGEIDGVISGKSMNELRVDFLIKKWICFVMLFGIPLCTMVCGVFIEFPFYVDLVIGMIAYLIYLILYHCERFSCVDFCQCKKKLMPKEEIIFARVLAKQKSIAINGGC